MKAVNLTNRIFKAALLLIFSVTVTLSYGQSKLYNVQKKEIKKRAYNCKHVGKQKVASKKFSKKQNKNYVSAVRTSQTVDTIFASTEYNLEFFASALVAEVKKVEKEMVESTSIPFPAPVYFRFDTDELTYEDIHQIVLAIEHVKLGKNIVLEGHTDSHGSYEYNKALSLKRANKIKKMMVEIGGISETAVSVRYFGEDKPAAPNDTHENRQLNRRVEFIVMQ